MVKFFINLTVFDKVIFKGKVQLIEVQLLNTFLEIATARHKN